MKSGVGLSKNTDPKDAVKEAVSAALDQIGSRDDLIAGMVYWGADYSPEAIAEAVADHLPGLPTIGCTTDGEISTDGLSIDSVCVMLLSSARVKARTAIVPEFGHDSFEAGRTIATELNDESARALILLPDGLTGNGSAVIRGASDVLGAEFVIAGGTAGDRGRFTQTWQLIDGKKATGALVGLMLYGDHLRLGFGVMSGWRPMGVAKEVTEAKDNTVYRIEDQTALEVYSTYLGDKASQLPAIGVEYPFALVDAHGVVDTRGMRDGEDYILLRAPMVVDNNTGAVSFAAEIPQGSKVKMTRAKTSDVIEASREAASRAMERLDGPPDLALFFSCMARKVVLGRKTQQEISAAQEIIGDSIPLAGFYTYGEIANCGEKYPICRFHNETATFLLIRETN